ncbi:MAG: DinB family protein [Acidobacteria bacterium]|nr:DinB family protein [Acidobacteriota bacterium]
MKERLKSQVDSMKEFFERSTRVLDEADSAFAPVEGIFTVAQQVAHTAQTVEWFVQGAFSRDGFDLDFERLDREMRAVASLEAARAWLNRAWAAAAECIEAHSGAEWESPLPPGPIMGGAPRHTVFDALADHTAHHRGSLAVYSRLLGKAPPMPYAEAM